MPLYDYFCPCGYTGEHYNKMDEYEKCPDCGKEMKRIPGGYHVIGDLDFVTENITGKPVHVTSRKQHKRLMQEHGVMEKYGKGWK